MKRSLSFLPLLGGFLLVGCGGPPSTAAPGASVAAPGAPTGVGTLSGNLEVAAFKGGYGIDFYEQAAKQFQALHPGLNIKVWGNPRVWEQLRPRLVAGSPPDLMFPGWGMDHWALAQEGQIFTLDKALDSPAYDGKESWRSTFKPSVLKLGQKDGKQYVLPYYVNVQGWWYDPGVFARNSWTPPKTFDDLLALCAKIKAKGIAPLTFQGQYPYYMIDGMLLPWVQSIGGIQAINDLQNLVPNAWKAPAVLQAAEMIKTLNDQGDFQKGAVGMSHTESQTEFLLGHAAMIPCGTWLFSEMKKVMPPGAQMRYFLPPVVAGAKGDPTAVEISIEPWMIPSAAKNPNAAIALFKYMTSVPVAKQFVQEKGTLMAINGSNHVGMPPTLVPAADAFNASKTVWAWNAGQWYTTMEKEAENAITAMLDNQITPQQFCDRVEAAAEKVRQDASIAKHKV